MGDDTKAHAPGYKSTEFWLALVAVLAGFVLASGAVVEGSTAATIVGGVLTVLGALGYTSSRTTVKVAEETARAEESKIAGYIILAKEKIGQLRESRRKAEAELAKAELTSSPTPVPNATPVVGADAANNIAGGISPEE